MPKARLSLAEFQARPHGSTSQAAAISGRDAPSWAAVINYAPCRFCSSSAVLHSALNRVRSRLSQFAVPSSAEPPGMVQLFSIMHGDRECQAKCRGVHCHHHRHHRGYTDITGYTKPTITSSASPKLDVHYNYSIANIPTAIVIP